MPNSGAAFGWAFQALPIFALVMLANVVWLAGSLVRLLRGERRSGVVAALLVAAWIAAFPFDNSHHGI